MNEGDPDLFLIDIMDLTVCKRMSVFKDVTVLRYEHLMFPAWPDKFIMFRFHHN